MTASPGAPSAAAASEHSTRKSRSGSWGPLRYDLRQVPVPRRSLVVNSAQWGATLESSFSFILTQPRGERSAALPLYSTNRPKTEQWPSMAQRCDVLALHVTALWVLPLLVSPWT